jgi:hypothetical protein
MDTVDLLLLECPHHVDDLEADRARDADHRDGATPCPAIDGAGVDAEHASDFVCVSETILICSSTGMRVVTLDAFAPLVACIKPYDRISRRCAVLV